MIVGLVVAAEGGVPLGYGMASIPVRGVERLANERGEFVFANIAGGHRRAAVRRIGYTPARITTTVRAGRDRLRSRSPSHDSRFNSPRYT